MARHEIRIEDVIGTDYWTGEGMTSKRFADLLKKAPATAEGIDLVVNSPGGDVFDGIAIFNELKNSGKSIHVYVRGLAASAASVIAMAGEKIIMEESSFMMIHNASGFVYGNQADMSQMMGLLQKMDGELAAVYARRTGQDESAVAKMMDSETWLTAEEAVAEGFATAALAETDAKVAARVVAFAPALAAFKYRRVPERVAAMAAVVAAPVVKDGPGKPGTTNMITAEVVTQPDTATVVDTSRLRRLRNLDLKTRIGGNHEC